MFRAKSASCTFVLLLVAAPAFAAPQAPNPKRLVIPEDLLSLREVSDVRLSPSGAQLAFVLSSIEKPSGREYSNIWIASTAGGSLKQLTDGAVNDTTPR